MDHLKSFSSPLPNGITAHHLELHNQSILERRPIIEFEYSEHDDAQIILTVFGPERSGLLADITDYLKSTTLEVRQANIYTLPSNAVMDQFILFDSQGFLQDEDTVHQLHDTLVKIISDKAYGDSETNRKEMSASKNLSATTTEVSDSLYNYALLGHRVPISLFAQRSAPRSGMVQRISSNIALRELEEEYLLEHEAARLQSEARTADFVEHAISSLINGEYLTHYSSQTRYRHRFFVSEDRTHLCWGSSHAVRLSRYAGCLYGPKSTVFQDLGDILFDPWWLCFSLVSNPPLEDSTFTRSSHPNTIDIICVSVDQLNRWLLGLQSLCRPPQSSAIQRLTLSDLNRMRVVYKIRARAHDRGLTLRRYILKTVREAGQRRNSPDAGYQDMDEILHVEAKLIRVKKSLVEHVRRETLLHMSLRDFQTSWEIDPANVVYLHPIGRGAFSEMWKAMWRSTPVAVKRLTTRSFFDDNVRADSDMNKSALGEIGDGRLSLEDRRMLQDFRAEVTMLNKLRHPNVVLFLGAVTILPNLSILTEFCHGGSLFNALRKKSWRTSLSLQDLRTVARHIARGVCYLHAMNIIHRDLKSQNLLLDRPVEEGPPNVKVADFGLSRNFNGLGTVTGSVAGVMTSETGTYRWMAPEMIRHEPYNEKVDVYSYGVVLWELFSCEVPFALLTPIQAAFAVADKHLRPKCESDYAKGVKIPLDWQALMERCWHRSSHERPRFREVLQILDEMETCDDGDVPPSLRKHVPKVSTRAEPYQQSRLKPSANILLEAESASLGESSDRLADFIKSDEVANDTGRTGLRRSGSLPMLTKLE